MEPYVFLYKANIGHISIFPSAWRFKDPKINLAPHLVW